MWKRHKIAVGKSVQLDLWISTGETYLQDRGSILGPELDPGAKSLARNWKVLATLDLWYRKHVQHKQEMLQLVENKWKMKHPRVRKSWHLRAVDGGIYMYLQIYTVPCVNNMHTQFLPAWVNINLLQKFYSWTEKSNFLS
jgi:hypothetical protein